MSKVMGIHTPNFQNLVNELNDFSSKNKVFATQTSFNNDRWYALIYYDDGKDKGKPYSQPPSHPQPSEKASKEQIDLLYKLDADFNEEVITKKEAWVLTNQLIKERGKKKWKTI